MNFTILTPGDYTIKDDKSSTVDGRFGGHREHSTTANEKDYTGRTGAASNEKMNPVDDTTRDIDDMNDPAARKREASRREETSNVQKSNEAGWQIKSDSDKRPRSDEGSDAVLVPEANPVKQHRKPNQWHFGTDNSPYEGELV